MPGEMPTAVELLANNVVLTPTQLAIVCELFFKKGKKRGQPNAKLARDLIRDGVLPLVDPTAAESRWTVSVADVQRHVRIAA